MYATEFSDDPSLAELCERHGEEWPGRYERPLSVDDDGLIAETPWWATAEWEDGDR